MNRVRAAALVCVSLLSLSTAITLSFGQRVAAQSLRAYDEPTATAATVEPGSTPTPVAGYEATATPVATAPATATLSVATVRVTPGKPAILSARVQVPIGVGSRQRTLRQSLVLLIPAGAVTEAVDLSVRVPPAASIASIEMPARQASNIPVDLAFDLSATNAQTGQIVQGITFRKPLFLQITYDQADLSAADLASLRIGFYQTSTGTWHPLSTTHDASGRVLTAMITHFTLFQVRTTARTQAQVRAAQARLATLAAAGAPQVVAVHVAASVIGGLPLIITLPSGQQRAPVHASITGAPGARAGITFTLSGVATRLVRILDGHGYAAASFSPTAPVKKAQQLRVVITVTGDGASHTASATLTLMPG